MRNKPLDDASTENVKLKAQLMIAYTVWHPGSSWDGQLYHRLHRAQDALADHPATAEVVLVHHTGTLFYQSGGVAIGRVQQLPIHRHQRRVRNQMRIKAAAGRRREERQAQAAPIEATRHGRGYSHQAYID